MKTPRIKHDAYYTHRRLTVALMNRYKLSGLIFECCSGDSAIASVLRQKSDQRKLGLKVITNDLFSDKANYRMDMTSRRNWDLISQQHKIDYIVSNPPFSEANKIIPLAWEYAQKGVIMLLRISWPFEACVERREFLINTNKNLHKVISFNPRPRFRADKTGSDSATVAWCVWLKENPTKQTSLEYVLDWKK